MLLKLVVAVAVVSGAAGKEGCVLARVVRVAGVGVHAVVGGEDQEVVVAE